MRRMVERWRGTIPLIACLWFAGCQPSSSGDGSASSANGGSASGSQSGVVSGEGAPKDSASATLDPSASAERAAREQAEAEARQRELLEQRVRRDALVAEVRAAADEDRWNDVEPLLERLRDFPTSPNKSEDQEFRQLLAGLDERLKGGRSREADLQRSQRLEQARQWIAAGRLDDAVVALREVVTRGPTDEQRASAQGLTEQVERIRQARRQLKSWLSMLASTEEREVQTAQSQLLQDPDTSVGMLLEALRSTEEERLAENYLETLQQLDRGDIVAPAMLEILGTQERKLIWPLITRRLPQLAGPAAGGALLRLAAESGDDAQRQGALEALSSEATPPVETLFVLAPRIASMPPTLRASALRVVARAVSLHGQLDLAAQRGWAESPSSDSVEAIEKLPEYLSELRKSAAMAADGAETAREAQRLLALWGLVESEAFTGIKLERVEAEFPESPGTALLDGVWNSIDPKTMWKHPIDRRGLVLLDLGESRVVTGVRIWNWNEPSGGQRGWKEVDVFVSDNPAELTPTTTAIVLPAPGVAESQDYGAFVPIPATLGRYVRLQAKSTWTSESHSGLSEVQVLGVR